MFLIFVGPPGAGKGTQASMLAKEACIPHISTGEMLRNAVAAGDELGLKVKSIIEGGQLVDDQTMLSVVKNRLSQDDCKKGFILDGFPRNSAQGEQFSALLKELGVELTACVYFEISDEEALKRMKSRSEQEGRADDTEEVQAKRIGIYKEVTEPLLNYYKESSKLVTVSSEASKEEVFTELKKAVKFD